MIKNILVPEKIGHYYIFPKRVIGFDIGRTHITATQIYLSGNNITIERCIEQNINEKISINKKLESGNELDHEQKTIQAIKNIVSQLDTFDEIYTSISSSNVIFKSLRLPFVSRSKIKMVVNYEVEPLLPFSAQDALIDFIITKKIKQENSSEIMVAAVQRDFVENHVKLFEQAGILPSKIVVDLLSLYSFYKNIPAYQNIKGSVVLLDIGFNVTRLAYIHDGRISFIRSLPKGIMSQAKDFSQAYVTGQKSDQESDQAKSVELFMRHGYKKLDDIAYKNAIESAAKNFWSSIKFTMQSFSSQVGQDVDVSKILILGQGAHILNISEFATNFLSVDCQLFQTSSFISKPNIKIKNALTISSSSIISLAVALPFGSMDEFNLYKIGALARGADLINRQLIVAGIFVLMIFSLLFVHSYVQISKTKREAKSSEQEIIASLGKKFKRSEEDETLDEVVFSAEQEVLSKEKEFAFAGRNRFSYLKYLLALQNSIIDKEGLGMDLESISISQPDNKIMIKAKVKSYPALKKLVKELRKSKLFRFVDSPEKLDFEMIIGLDKNV